MNEGAGRFAGETELGDFFEAALAVAGDAGEVAKWMVNDVLREAKETPVTELMLRARERMPDRPAIMVLSFEPPSASRCRSRAAIDR